MTDNSKKVKHIFVLGTAVSGLGKGIVAASIGRLLKCHNYKVTIQKFDPYFNSSASSLNPLQHGEVTIFADGTEMDMDGSTYERFIDEDLGKNNSLTSGIIYGEVLKKEKEGYYLGQTIQIIPHVTDEVKRNIHIFDDDYDIVIHEIGGNIGDIEAAPYVETVRQVQYNLGKENCLIVVLVYLPYLRAAQEVKTKIAQQGVEKCRSLGIIPDILICRAEEDFNDKVKKKLSLYSNINEEFIIKNLDAESIYAVPKMLMDEGIIHAIDEKLKLGLQLRTTTIEKWNDIVLNNYTTETVNIALVGKYIDLHDAYISVTESLKFAGWKNKVDVNIIWIDAESLEEDITVLTREKLDGILIPGGFGYRGVEGKILAARYARENKIPCLGLCLGFQVMAIEFARNVLGLKDANSEEFNEHSPNLVISIMDEQRNLKEMAGTLRLGSYKCRLHQDSIAYSFYKEDIIDLRHRHRYEFNNQYREEFKKHGILFAGLSLDNKLVEIMEYRNHPFYLGTQGHPEFDSRPNRVNPLFDAFIYYAKNTNRKVPRY